jgi:hypothetical protein
MRGKEVNMNKEQRKLEEWWNKKSKIQGGNGATVNKEQRKFAVEMTKQSQANKRKRSESEQRSKNVSLRNGGPKVQNPKRISENGVKVNKDS